MAESEIADPAALLILDGTVTEGDAVRVRAAAEPGDALVVTPA